MSQSSQFIEELGDEDVSINPASTIQDTTRKCLRSKLLSQLDVFSAQVNLNIDGSDVSKTKFGGIVSLTVLAFCLWLTGITFFSDGLSLKSRITMTVSTQNQFPNSTIFDYADQFIRINMYKRGTNQKVPILQNFTAKAFLINLLSNGTNITTPLTLSNNCQASQICLKKEGNINFDISGFPVLHSLDRRPDFFFNPNLTYKESKQIYFQLKWTSINYTAPISNFLNKWQVNFGIAQKRALKGGQVSVYYQDHIYLPIHLIDVIQSVYSVNVTKQNFQFNNKILGHLGNILPQFSYGYALTGQMTQRNSVRSTYRYLNGVNGSTLTSIQSIHCLYFMNTGNVQRFTEQFDDITLPILFFLSVKQTIYLLAVILLVNRYNLNANLLKISNTLFTMQDHTCCEKFDFESFSPSVILACFLYNHPLSQAIDFMLRACGKNVYEIIPRKCFYSIMMMKKAQQLLSEDSFFGGLEELSALQDQPPKKILLIDQYDQESKNAQEIQTLQKQQIEINYFPCSETKRLAFDNFCKANGFTSIARKNHFYRILTSKNLQFSLPQLAKKQFKSYFDNVSAKVKQGQLNLSPDHDDEIPVKLVSDKDFNREKEASMLANQESSSNLKITKQQKQDKDQKLKSSKSLKSDKSGKDLKKVNMEGILDFEDIEDIQDIQDIEGTKKMRQHKQSLEVANNEQIKNNDNQGPQNSVHFQIQSFDDNQEHDL